MEANPSSAENVIQLGLEGMEAKPQRPTHPSSAEKVIQLGMEVTAEIVIQLGMES